MFSSGFRRWYSGSNEDEGRPRFDLDDDLPTNAKPPATDNINFFNESLLFETSSSEMEQVEKIDSIAFHFIMNTMNIRAVSNYCLNCKRICTHVHSNKCDKLTNCL